MLILIWIMLKGISRDRDSMAREEQQGEPTTFHTLP